MTSHSSNSSESNLSSEDTDTTTSSEDSSSSSSNNEATTLALNLGLQDSYHSLGDNNSTTDFPNVRSEEDDDYLFWFHNPRNPLAVALQHENLMNLETFLSEMRANMSRERWWMDTERVHGQNFLEKKFHDDLLHMHVMNSLLVIRDLMQESGNRLYNVGCRYVAPSGNHKLDFKDVDSDPLEQLNVNAAKKCGTIVLCREENDKKWSNQVFKATLKLLHEHGFQFMAFSLGHQDMHEELIALSTQSIKQKMKDNSKHLESMKTKTLRYVVMSAIRHVLQCQPEMLLIVDCGPSEIIDANSIEKYTTVNSFNVITTWTVESDSDKNELVEKIRKNMETNDFCMDCINPQNTVDETTNGLKFSSAFTEALSRTAGRSKLRVSADKKLNEVILSTKDSTESSRWQKNKEKWIWKAEEMGPEKYVTYLKRLFVSNHKKSAFKGHLKFNNTFIIKRDEVSESELIFFEKPYKQFFNADQLHYLNTPFPKYVPEICIDVKEFIQNITWDATANFNEAVIHYLCGWKDSRLRQTATKVIILLEQNNPVLDLLSASLWFWEDFLISSWQKSYNLNNTCLDTIVRYLRSSTTMLKTQGSDYPNIYFAWMSTGLKYFLNNCSSRIIIIDVARPGISLGNKIPEIIEEIGKNGDAKIINTLGETQPKRTIDIVENILNGIMSTLNPSEKMIFRKARQMYRRFRIDASCCKDDEKCSEDDDLTHYDDQYASGMKNSFFNVCSKSTKPYFDKEQSDVSSLSSDDDDEFLNSEREDENQIPTSDCDISRLSSLINSALRISDTENEHFETLKGATRLILDSESEFESHFTPCKRVQSASSCALQVFNTISGISLRRTPKVNDLTMVGFENEMKPMNANGQKRRENGIEARGCTSHKNYRERDDSVNPSSSKKKTQ